MAPERLMSELTHEILEENRAHRWRTTIVSVCASVVVTSMIAIGVTVYLTDQDRKDSYARSRFNCEVQRVAQIEGNNRVIYTKATKAIIKHFHPVEAWLRKARPDLYPLPDIKYLKPINCDKLPTG